MNCPICGNQIVNNQKQCSNCGYILPYIQQQNNNYNQNINNNQQQQYQQMQTEYGYQQENKVNQPYYSNNQQYNQQYNQPYINNQPKKNSGLGIIIATILIGMLLCCGAPLGITLVGLNIIENTNTVDTEHNEEDYYNPDFGYGGQRQEWENDETRVLYDTTLELEFNIVPNSVITEEGDVEFALDMYNKGPEMVDISISEAKINNKTVRDFDSEPVRLGSNTVIDGYDQTSYGEIFRLRSNIDEIESFTVKFKIYYPNLDKTFETTEFYITDSGFSYEADVINAEKIIASTENKNNNASVDNSVGFNYYGSEEVGYVILDGFWTSFLDVEGASLTNTTVQYTNGSRILTMDLYANTLASISGENLYRSLSNDSNVYSATVIDSGYTATTEYYQILAEYYDGTLWTVAFITDYNTGNTLYFSYETYLGGADKAEFLEEAYTILSTYTFESGQTI